MSTGDLFDTKRMARRSDPATSHRAAHTVVLAGIRLSHAEACLRALQLTGRWTAASEIATIIGQGILPYEVRKRLPELEREGKIEREPDPTGREQRWRVRR